MAVGWEVGRWWSAGLPGWHAFKRLNVSWEYRAGLHQALLTLACLLLC
jgi:hypothetical protein